MPKPSIGRIVRYVQHTGKIRPAIIVEVHPTEGEQDVVDLRVFQSVLPVESTSEQSAVARAFRDDHKLVGTWHWPEREA